MLTVRSALPLLLAVPLLAGCAAGTDAALTAKDAQNNVGVAQGALTQLGAASATDVQALARGYLAEHSSMVGFAANLRASQPAMVAGTSALSDTSVTMRVTANRCVTAALPTGPAVPAPC